MFDDRHHQAAAASIQERKRECRDRAAAMIHLHRGDGGLSLREVARKLDAAGIWPPAAFTGNHFWRERNRWSAMAVKRIAEDLGLE